MSGGTGAIQVRNAELVDILSTDFIRRNEATVAWGKAVGMHQMLPGLRGFWPMSSANESMDAIDLSGQGRNLTSTGSLDYAIYDYENLIPFADLDGTDYFSRSDEAGLDIIGNETYIASALRGLTIEGWFKLDTIAPGSAMGLFGKWNENGVNQRSYLMYFNDADNTIRFSVSTDGTAVVSVTGAVVAASTWLH